MYICRQVNEYFVVYVIIRKLVYLLMTGMFKSSPTASNNLNPSMSGICTSLNTISTGSLPARSTDNASVALPYVDTGN